MSMLPKEKKPLSPKKRLQQEIMQQLAMSLPGLKDILGEKKFERRIKKAARILAAGIRPKN